MTREQAIALSKTGWWKDKEPRIVAEFQLQEPLLCMDMGDFQMAVEEALGRSVWTHELASPDRLLRELRGERRAPTMDEILDMIPEAKRVLVLI